MCWCKGSVAERILLPLADYIRQLGGTISGSTFAQDLVLNPAGTGISAVKVVDKQGKQSTLEADAVIFAVGINGEPGSGPLGWRLLPLVGLAACIRRLQLCVCVGQQQWQPSSLQFMVWKLAQSCSAKQGMELLC